MSITELKEFLSWAEENEIVWNKDDIEIKKGKHGFSVYAKRSLEAGYEAIKVPKSIILSIETTGIANLLADEDIEGYIGLTVGCMYEVSCGKNSPWCAYLEMLARNPPQMLTSLPKESREMLKYCEAYNDIESDIKDIQDDYESIVVPFIEKYPEIFTKSIKEKFFSFEAFKSMTEQVSSRSMDVDHFHITALVPFADFVNHSSNPNSDFLTHEDVCEVCGALACEHMEDSDDEDGEDSDDDENAIEDGDEAPQLVGEGGKASKKSKTDDSDSEGEDEEVEDGDADEEGDWEDDDEDMGEDEDGEDEDEEMLTDTCDIILDLDVKKGEEITRHYGPYTNKVYLSKYGFSVQDNEYDTLTVQLDMIQQAASKFLKDDSLIEERIAWFLEKEDLFIGADDEHEHEHEHEHGGGCCGHEGEESCSADDSEDEDMSKSGDKSHKVHDEEKQDEKQSDEEMDEDEDEDEEDDDEEEEDFPKDIMYMSSGGHFDDRSILLLNVLFMEKSQFEKANEDLDMAMEYFSEVFIRRQQEEPSPEDDEDEDEKDIPILEPRNAKSKKVQKSVLLAILELIRIRAEAFGVTFKSTAQKDLTNLKKAKLSDTLYYGGLCVYGEKSILENGIRHYGRLLKEL